MKEGFEGERRGPREHVGRRERGQAEEMRGGAFQSA